LKRLEEAVFTFKYYGSITRLAITSQFDSAKSRRYAWAYSQVWHVKKGLLFVYIRSPQTKARKTWLFSSF